MITKPATGLHFFNIDNEWYDSKVKVGLWLKYYETQLYGHRTTRTCYYKTWSEHMFQSLLVIQSGYKLHQKRIQYQKWSFEFVGKELSLCHAALWWSSNEQKTTSTLS